MLTDARDTIIGLRVPTDVTDTAERPGSVLTALCTGVAGLQGTLVDVWNEKQKAFGWCWKNSYGKREGKDAHYTKLLLT